MDKFVEFFGAGASSLTVADRATIANMAPEYGATMGYFPADDKTLRLSCARQDVRGISCRFKVKMYLHRSRACSVSLKIMQLAVSKLLELDLSLHRALCGWS